MSEKLAPFSKEKEYFLTSNMMSSFQISTQKSLREKEGGGGERGKRERKRQRKRQRLCVSMSKK